MTNITGFDPSRYEVGFDILFAKIRLKRQFDEAGMAGLVAFIGACIAYGMTHEDDIKSAAADIAGPYFDDSIDAVIAENGMGSRNPQWMRAPDGRLFPAR